MSQHTASVTIPTEVKLRNKIKECLSRLVCEEEGMRFFNRRDVESYEEVAIPIKASALKLIALYSVTDVALHPVARRQTAPYVELLALRTACEAYAGHVAARAVSGTTEGAGASGAGRCVCAFADRGCGDHGGRAGKRRETGAGSGGEDPGAGWRGWRVLECFFGSKDTSRSEPFIHG